jgi:hypothetical protein
MSERRFTDKPDLDPEAVWSLDINHAAMRENRTLFPSTVVTVTVSEPERILVSGKNNRKLGGTVEKGKFGAYAIYGLSLEERATCPSDCEMRGACYGNGMQMARRHRIGDPEVFYQRLEAEIKEILSEEFGLLIRLHVLGDFPNIENVAFWSDMLAEHDALACYGYTHWGRDTEIEKAIAAVKEAYPDRFRIRWSGQDIPDGSIVIEYVPQKPRTKDGALVCPSQTDSTACCATCALCWDAPHETIAFIKHGPKGTPVMPTVLPHKAIAKAPKKEIAMQELPPVARTSAGLRDALFDAIDGVRSGKLDPHRAKALAGLAREVVNTVKLEIDIHKLGKPIKAEDAFYIAALPLGQKEIEHS